MKKRDYIESFKEGYSNFKKIFKDLWDSRVYSKVLMKNELEEKDSELEKLLNVVEDLKIENNDFKDDNKRLERIYGDLEKSKKDLEGARNLIIYSRESKKKSEFLKKESDKRLIGMRDFVLDLVNRDIEHGVHPLTLESGGRYAFIDKHGLITSMSLKTQKVFGYEPGQVDYHDIVSRKRVKEFSNILEETIVDNLYVNVKEGEIKLKDVKVTPLIKEGIYLGSVVDFHELGIIEKLRNSLVEVTRERAKKIIEDAEEIARNSKRNLGLES